MRRWRTDSYSYIAGGKKHAHIERGRKRERERERERERVEKDTAEVMEPKDMVSQSRHKYTVGSASSHHINGNPRA